MAKLRGFAVVFLREYSIYYLIYTLFESVVNKYGQFLRFSIAYVGM